MNVLRTKTLFRIALGVVALTLSVRMAYYAATEGFSIARIEAPLPYGTGLATPPPSDRVLQELSVLAKQPFRYMKKGSQAYAFISDDGKVILKLFKLHHMQPAEWMYSIPCPGFLRTYRDSLVQRRQYRIDLTLTSYAIAASHIPEECALIYAQILPSKTFSLPVTIVDAIGRTYTIDLAHHGFALQYKASLVVPALEQWIDRGEMEEARSALDSMVALIAQRSSKGFQDSDPDLHKNAGFIGTSAVHIDIGSFFPNPKISSRDTMRRDMKKIFARLLEWLSAASPELHAHLLSRLDNPDGLVWTPPHV